MIYDMCPAEILLSILVAAFMVCGVCLCITLVQIRQASLRQRRRREVARQARIANGK